MKTPKFIKDIAKRITEQDAERYDFIADNPEGFQKDTERHLMSVRKALLTGKLYLGVNSVSRSGMSRVIKIRYIEDNTLRMVSDDVYKLAGCDKNHRIDGCGMDMLFAAQYNLFVTLCPKHDYTKAMPRYNHL